MSDPIQFWLFFMIYDTFELKCSDIKLTFIQKLNQQSRVFKPSKSLKLKLEQEKVSTGINVSFYSSSVFLLHT